jgi:hypothetical protein
MASRGGRSLLIGGLLSAGVVLVVSGGSVMALFGPALLRDISLDREVKVATIRWRSHGETEAREALRYGLASSGFGADASPESMCVFETAGGDRVLTCEWEERVRVPVLDVVVPVVFHSVATLDSEGDVR